MKEKKFYTVKEGTFCLETDKKMLQKSQKTFKEPSKYNNTKFVATKGSDEVQP